MPLLQVLDEAGYLQPEPSPAVTRLKRQARALERSPPDRASAGKSPFVTPAELQVLQDCDRVADSPDRETPSSPSTRPSIPAAEDLDATGRPRDQALGQAGVGQRGGEAFSGKLRIQTFARQIPRKEMPPPRRVVRPLPAAQNQSQGKRSQKSSQPGQDGLYMLKTRQRAPSQVLPDDNILLLFDTADAMTSTEGNNLTDTWNAKNYYLCFHSAVTHLDTFF